VVVGEIGVNVEGFVFWSVVLKLGKNDREERGRVAGGRGRVLGEDLGVVCYAGAEAWSATKIGGNGELGGRKDLGHTRAAAWS
jgi:hypothetical protein